MTGSSSPRQEAERLVATLLGAVSVGIQGAETRRQLSDLAGRFLDSDWFAPAAGDPVSGDGPAGHPGGDEPAGHATGGGPGGYATGSAECCLCPICRVIAELRDPSPEFADRLATAAGDLAVGLTGVLRAFGEVLRPRPAQNGDPWHSATREGTEAAPPPPSEQRRPMAKKAVRKPATRPAGPPDPGRAD